ncbi:uncharacterized protein FTOL_06493 [Fusarium torulosum]|uniref:Uncharacterized protein n=1 Tax=Fusarium torulosum TaxID=33205 RepID=A0AAE8M958_9HYPO|nr:uncharacterized protein FTOL_06493 [Fusarium torulosum]
MAQVTGLDHEASATSGSGVSYTRTSPPALTSASASASAAASQKSKQDRYSYQHPLQSGTQARTRRRAKSASNLLSRPDQEVEFHDDTFIDQQELGETHDGIAELIDFLRNHSPPSGNFMSIPDDISPEDRGRWSRLRKIGKRSRSLSKPPQTIQLPDSAVSGTTIGGHRHIAISIPLDASPFGRTPRSQYPVYQHRAVRTLTSQYAPTRAVLNDKGVVTVLRTVNEDRESTPSVSPANSQLLLATIPQRHPNTTMGGQHPPRSINSSNQTNESENWNDLARPPPRIVTQDQVRQANEQSREFQNFDQGNTHAASPNYPQRVPSRKSSSTGGRVVHLGDLSIDTMMSQPTERDVHAAPTSPARPVSPDGSYQPSLSKSIMTTSDNDPVVAEARPVETRPVAARESHIRSPTKQPSEPSITVITRSPLRVSREPSKRQMAMEASSTSETRSPRSRRDKVKDKKKRDMEAASLKRRSMMSIASEPTMEAEQETTKVPQNESEEPPPVPLRSPQRQSMCPIVVVASVKPSPPPSATLSASPKKQASIDSGDFSSISTAKPSEAVPNSREGTSSRPVSPYPASYINGSPTPPQSARSSPVQKEVSQDRTSLSRRREWKAAREQERERKRTEAPSNTNPRPKGRRLTTAKEETDDRNPVMEKEVLRRYEAYREYRIREMERRLRRLERNGDVWLRALVPVLDNLNRTLATKDEKPQRAQGWVSDDERSQFQPSSQMRPSSRGRMMTRRGTSEREFLEQLVRTKEELEAGSVSDDMSGFDTIEPLMRELAGRSRLSFEARSLGMDDEGLLNSLAE